ncbi:hypothetical protein AMTR_s00077p00163180 [Amborella trichopoda]|uniref:Uncharacterized protein n=1 Tax=Amborella trichopoda TaxID=13333 RepID=W1PB68_AMBTC|nr:hypothetical protein AMTR_s00077p00163180 [Amborella trichopoda]
METSGTGTENLRGNTNTRRYGMNFSASNLIQSPLSALLEYSGILRGRQSHQESGENLAGIISRSEDSSGAEVSIRIIGAGEQEHLRSGSADSGEARGFSSDPIAGISGPNIGAHGEGEGASSSSSSSAPLVSGIDSGASNPSEEVGSGVGGGNGRESSYQRYDIQQLAKWIEQILPFSLLLLVVFIRQHLQGFFVTFWIAAVMIKSNDILRKQTALKGERRITILVGITLIFVLHVVGVYYWYRNDDLLYPLVMLPPKAIPPFWHAIFTIVVNDTMVRQAAMVVKCILLMYYKNSRGRNYRKQGQMLTLVEYVLLLYRALLPTPVWYRFFLNKDYGSLFSSLTTGLYLTFKLTSIVEKVQSFFAALKALSRKEVHYGSYATTEQEANSLADTIAKGKYIIQFCVNVSFVR